MEVPVTEHPIQVVVAFDFTPSAEQALARAVDVAARAPQHVLHVIAILDTRGSLPFEHGKSYANADHVQQAISERVAAAFEGRETASEVQFFVHARIGKPVDEILRLCEEVGADLVFIGSHGKTGVERFLLGSTSERVVREAKCPVMVVRAKTYPNVELERVVPYEHDRHAFHAPHRYSYADQRVIKRPPDWPLS